MVVIYPAQAYDDSGKQEEPIVVQKSDNGERESGIEPKKRNESYRTILHGRDRRQPCQVSPL